MMRDVLVAVGSSLISLAVLSCIAADEAMPTKWEFVAHVKVEPSRKLYIAQVEQQQDGYTVWEKTEYDSPQQSAKGSYSTRITFLKQFCAVHQYSILRDTKYSADGKVIWERNTNESDAERSKLPTIAELSQMTGSGKHLSEDAQLAVEPLEFTCNGVSEDQE